jgi:sulfatase maturation enzyme AslB (radical SAM superfamily)
MATLPLLPDHGTKLVGIARLASHGETLRQGHAVEYFTLPSRSLLNRTTGARVPFTWTINPYRGCEFACKYCYARYTHEFMEMHEAPISSRRFTSSSMPPDSCARSSVR